MRTSKLVRTYDSLMSRITIVKAGGYMFTWMPGRRAYVTRNGRVIKNRCDDLMLNKLSKYSRN